VEVGRPRHGYPADVVEAILFLAGDRAGWITGTTLPIDGGVLAGRSALPGTRWGQGAGMTLPTTEAPPRRS
jgi:hypothetical protein